MESRFALIAQYGGGSSSGGGGGASAAYWIAVVLVAAAVIGVAIWLIGRARSKRHSTTA